MCSSDLGPCPEVGAGEDRGAGFGAGADDTLTAGSDRWSRSRTCWGEPLRVLGTRPQCGIRTKCLIAVRPRKVGELRAMSDDRSTITIPRHGYAAMLDAIERAVIDKGAFPKC